MRKKVSKKSVVKGKVKAVKAKKSVVKKVRDWKTGKRPLLNSKQHASLIALHKAGKHKVKDLAIKFKVSVPTLYNYLVRKVSKD